METDTQQQENFLWLFIVDLIFVWFGGLQVCRVLAKICKKERLTGAFLPCDAWKAQSTAIPLFTNSNDVIAVLHPSLNVANGTS